MRQNVTMIVSIRHSALQDLFEKGAASGMPRELKGYLLLWLSVIHATSDLRDLSISKVSTLSGEKGNNSYRLGVLGLGTFSFRFVDGEIRQLSYKQDPK